MEHMTVIQFAEELFIYFWPLWVIAAIGVYLFIRDEVKKHRSKDVYRLQRR